MIKAFLPRHVPTLALSATLTKRVTRDIKEKLQLSVNYLFVNVGNDRSNVSIIVRALHNKIDSYTDLSFVVPPIIHRREDVPKAWIYVDNINEGTDIVDYLRSRLPPDLQDAVRPYNAILSQEYRTEAMKQFREGLIRILVCTDAAGMVSGSLLLITYN